MLGDLKLVSLSITAEYIGIDSENNFFDYFQNLFHQKLSVWFIIAEGEN